MIRVKCPTCKGEGKYECLICKGSKLLYGGIVCFYCNGKGHNICVLCLGKGYVECETLTEAELMRSARERGEDELGKAV